MDKKEQIIAITVQIAELTEQRNKLNEELRNELPIKEGDAVRIVYKSESYGSDPAFIGSISVSNDADVDYTFKAVNKNGQMSKHNLRPNSYRYTVEKI